MSSIFCWNKSTKLITHFFFYLSYRHQDSTLLYADHERCLQKTRNLGVPKAPKTAKEIQEAINRPEIYDIYCKVNHTDKRDIFLDHLYDGKDFSYCVFTSKKIYFNYVKKLDVKNRHFLIDGTFKVVPFGCFNQLLVIHVQKFETVHPFVYVLMSNRTQVAYEHVFNYIHKHIFKLHCSSFTSDYEVAMKNALRSVFPESHLVSCWFHFVQAIRKKASKIPELLKLISTVPEAAHIYYKFQSLALLRWDLIDAAFNKLANEALLFNKQAFEPFVDYFKRQWIVKVGLIFFFKQRNYVII